MSNGMRSVRSLIGGATPTDKTRSNLWWLCPIIAGILGSSLSAEQVVLEPVKDNTIFEITNGSLSNGADDNFFAGVTGENRVTRALIAFDLSQIPPGSTVTNVTLTLIQTNPNNNVSANSPVALHRLSKDWGEGTSVGVRGGGQGASATTNDATWLHTFFNSQLWSSPGGDYAQTTSATRQVGGNGTYTWDSTEGLLADVQAWVNDQSTNFGWILIGQEGSGTSAKRFGSREASVLNRPKLQVDFTQPVELSIVDEFYFPLVGDGSVANILFQTAFFLTNIGSDATVDLLFRDRSGQPLLVSLGGLGTNSDFEVNLSQGEAASLQSAGTGDPSAGGLSVGYVIVRVKRAQQASTLQTGETSGDVGGTAVFARTEIPAGVVLYEAGVPATRTLDSFTVFLDSLANKDTGLAIVNPPDEAQATANLQLTVRDKSAQTELGSVQLALADGDAIGKFIWEIFRDSGASQNLVDQLRETEAVVEVVSDQPVSAVTLRQNDDPAAEFPQEVPTLTTFPVVSGVASGGSSPAER